MSKENIVGVLDKPVIRETYGVISMFDIGSTAESKFSQSCDKSCDCWDCVSCQECDPAPVSPVSR